MQALRHHRKPYPLRSRMRRRADIVPLVLLALGIILLAVLALSLGPDLWVLLNAWMQQEAGQA